MQKLNAIVMNRIKGILKEQGISINELAEKMRLNRVTLSTQNQRGRKDND